MTDKRLLGGWLVGQLIISIVVGCGSEKQVREGMPALYPEDYSFGTNWIGTLVMNEQKVVSIPSSHDTIINATFIDFSNYKVYVASRDPYPTNSPYCFIYTGLPFPPDGEKVVLNVNSVTVSGLVDGDHSLSSNGTSYNFQHDNRAFGTGPVAFEVDSSTGQNDFPAFSDQINAPVFPELLRLNNSNSPDLSTALSLGINLERTDPLIVEWEGSTADYFEVLIIPNTGSSTPYAKLRCIVYDDGYLAVPVEAIYALALDTCTNWRFRIERHNFKLHTIVDGEATKAVALIDVSSALEGIVLK